MQITSIVYFVLVTEQKTSQQVK